MGIRQRQYQAEQDYRLVSRFLIRNHNAGNVDGNWLEPAWEYMNFHPNQDTGSLQQFGIWEEDDDIVAIAHYEEKPGECFLQVHPEYRFLRKEMLDYAEANLVGVDPVDSNRYLMVFVNDNDMQLQDLIKERGYIIDPEGVRPEYRFDIPREFPEIHLPEGFRLTSLAEECDWAKVHRVLWRGFDHPGDPIMSVEEFEGRRKMFDTPKARRDLKVAVADKDGRFVAFCGMFYESENWFAYVEPVATDPEFRRMGLGKAAVLEGIKRCAALGAKAAYVLSDQRYYQAIGFKKVFNSDCWRKSM